MSQNHRTPAPQYFNGRLQFLLPLSFERPDCADLVLAVEPYDEFYRATTCLTLAMAYSNARLLGRPDRHGCWAPRPRPSCARRDHGDYRVGRPHP